MFLHVLWCKRGNGYVTDLDLVKLLNHAIATWGALLVAGVALLAPAVPDTNTDTETVDLSRLVCQISAAAVAVPVLHNCTHTVVGYVVGIPSE